MVKDDNSQVEGESQALTKDRSMQEKTTSFKKRSLFQVIFGNELGEMVQLIAGMIAFMAGIYLYMLIPSFLMRTLSSSGGQTKTDELKQLPLDTRSVISEIGKVRVKTQELLQKLEQEIGSSEKLLEKKKATLNELQQKISLLALTPDQLKIVTEYEESLKGKLPIKEWISQPVNIYSFLMTLLISGFFYLLGRRREKKRFLKSQKLSIVT